MSALTEELRYYAVGFAASALPLLVPAALNLTIALEQQRTTAPHAITITPQRALAPRPAAGAPKGPVL